MEEAIRWYSWKGHCVDRIRAIDVKSHAAAYKVGPFVDQQIQPVLWVGWGRRENGKAIPPYFRHWPKSSNGRNWCPDFKQEIKEIESAKAESEIHKRAKVVCLSALSKMIHAGEPLPWAFKDVEASDFPLTGNLLADVTHVKPELGIRTPFSSERYRFDVGLLGPRIIKNDQCLGAIEFEITHRVGMWKTAVCRSLGFPLITIDLASMSLTDVTEEWCRGVLTETTQTSTDGRRRNYFFVHTMLYPVYLDLPSQIRSEPRHRFVVFAKDNELEELTRLIRETQRALKLSSNSVLIQSQPNKNDQTAKQMAHEGSMAGHDWRKYNDHNYLRVSIDVPPSKFGPLYRLHLALAHLLTSRYDCLVGYKYQPVVFNTDRDNPIWSHREWRNFGEWTDFKVAPKHLSHPMRPLREYLKLVDNARHTDATVPAIHAVASV